MVRSICTFAILMLMLLFVELAPYDGVGKVEPAATAGLSANESERGRTGAEASLHPVEQLTAATIETPPQFTVRSDYRPRGIRSVVFFQRDSAVLSPIAIRSIETAILNARRSGYSVAMLLGPSRCAVMVSKDRGLCVRRRETVEAVLLARGIRTAIMPTDETPSFGPALDFDDGVRDDRNGWIEIYIRSARKNQS
ncbi:MAG: hypothetical protein R3229_13690 [Alphaproteobacteria bacterium]|nr:hypothetical protein [Alphaproteobacteria bacterium]